MTRKHWFFIAIAITGALLVSAVSFALFKDSDPYKDFTGLGSSIAISPDDKEIAFSAYQEGEEAIYIAGIDGKDVKRVVDIKGKRLHNPVFSFTSDELLFLAEGEDGTNVLYSKPLDGEPEQKTEETLHIRDAVFGPDKSIYIIAMKASEFNKEPGETTEGFDLYHLKEGSDIPKKLTEENHFSMDNLSVSENVEAIYYSDFKGENERLYRYSLAEQSVTEEVSAQGLEIEDMYNNSLAPDGKHIAFSAVSEESKESSLFEYDLFVKNMDNGKTKQLTDLSSAVESPTYFHDQDTIAFLEHTNWPNDPAVYSLKRIDTNGENMATIELDLPLLHHAGEGTSNQNSLVNPYMIGGLYVLFLVLWSFYLLPKGKTFIYRPVKISSLITILVFAASFVVAFLGKPWLGIGLGMVAGGPFICSLIAFICTFLLWIWKSSPD